MSLQYAVQTALRAHFAVNPAAIQYFSAPGRVNLMGEHTDYNDGFVLPVAINFRTVVAAAAGHDTLIRIVAVDKNQTDEFDLSRTITPHPTQSWSNYVRGMARVLPADGHPPAGMRLAVSGDVPTSGGLSSSASFEMALGHAFLQMSGLPVDGVALALSGQKTENDFVGVQCGVMDQFISALGQKDHALLIDCRDLSSRPIPISPQTAVIVVDSGVQRGLVDSEYNARRQQCEAAAAHLGVKALRDADEKMLAAQQHAMNPVIYRRARHVITENARVLQTAKALAGGDMQALGPLMAASHRSMRNDFEITTPAIDTLVEIMQNVPGVYGARMTGGGFGGSCIALAPVDIFAGVKAAVDKFYTRATGRRATAYLCRASAGAGKIR